MRPTPLRPRPDGEGPGRGGPAWGAPLIALEFLTTLRLRRVRRWDDASFGAAVAWFPAVGLLLGGGLWALDRGLSELLPPEPTAAILVAALALASGGLHLDGVADTADGLALQGDRNQRLGVMSEGTTGPAGVMALVLILLAQWAALVALADPVRDAGLLLAPALARWAIVPVALAFRPARPRGLGHAVAAALWPITAPLATVIAAGAALVLFGAPGLVLLALAAAAALLVAGASARMLHGITGDTHGAAIELAQVVVWLAIVAAGAREWLEPLTLS